MRALIPFFSSIFLLGCADANLDDAEAAVPKFSPNEEMSVIAARTRALSMAYVNAARETTKTQDFQSLLIFLAAGAVVKGLVDKASDVALSNTALAGATVQQIGTRTAPKSAIVGMYVGAKRLNCIATVSEVASHSLAEQTLGTRKAAQALAFGAVEEVKITTRESLIREIADYDKLVTDILPPGTVVPSVAIANGVNDQKLKAFSGELDKCLAKKAET